MAGVIDLYAIGARRYQIIERKPASYHETTKGWCVQPAGLPCSIHVETEEQAIRMRDAIAEVWR